MAGPGVRGRRARAAGLSRGGRGDGADERRPVPADATPHWSVNFWVGDADAIAGRAVRLGGRAVILPYDAPGFREAVLVDPQGVAFSVRKLTAGA